jgi:mannitol/fructose-specific phosphotransferase system IIA component (Ntr-type)
MLTETPPTSLVQATLADYTRRELVVARLVETDTAGIISELSQALQRQGAVPDLLGFYSAALNRELMDNSSLQCGIAFPHARVNAVKQLQFAFGRAPRPVMWGAKGRAPVQLVFLLAVPATDAACYLHLLASIARLGQQPDRLSELCAAEGVDEIMTVLQNIGIRRG